MNRDRSIIQAPRDGGKLCDAHAKSETVPCNTQSCDIGCIDAEWEAFGEWSECSASCGDSYRFRSRKIKRGANHCGRPLEGNMQDFEPCEPVDLLGFSFRLYNSAVNPIGFVDCRKSRVDCEFTEWTQWGPCSYL